MRRQRAILTLTAWTLALCCSIGAATAQKAYGPGVSDSEIKLGANAPYSGPASIYASFPRTMLAYFAVLNEKGGIRGRQINYVTRDDAYSPPKTVEVTRSLVENEQVLAIMAPFGTPTNAAIQKYLNSKGVPQLLVQSGGTRWNDPKQFPWTTPYSPTYVNESRIIARYILQTKPEAKVGVLMQADDIGKDFLLGLKQGLGTKADKMIVKEESYQSTEPTIDSQIVNLKASGADTILIAAQNKFASMAIRKIYELGWKPQIFLGSTANSISGVLIPAGLEASTGVLTTTSYKTPNDPSWANDKGMTDYLAFTAKYLPGMDPNDVIAVTGYTTAQLGAIIIERCGDELTRENVLKQATNLKGIELPMLLPGISIQTTPDDYAAITERQFARFDGKTWVLFGDILGAGPGKD
ncbi:ABC transporter substrate-binding protein [Bradyrhizobium sp. Leo121]|uniref:ABC transporter substrate-binding protein n=1 Tax=Bradyrhizobium sp. Leo121 TaxID=1571195 RepID=UPI00102A1E65|nr:ABC transporter substrate-binding protein [Bradyrhizobium sp. Leo121]RZN30766.1 branched-chain amino acid ABC transporter substrate-binding protein [Bradyrhizobium sp. Leo121]